MTKANILIVEDEFITAENLRDHLEALGYSICAVVASGQRAVEEAEQKNPDLVLMDIVLQNDMDGIEAAQLIGGRFDIPIIYLTAYSDESIVERAKVTQPMGYLIKPIAERDLEIAIEMALYRRSMEQTLRESAERLRLTYELAPVGIAECDLKGRFRKVNRALCEMSGYSEDELLDLTFQEITHPEDRANIEQVFLQPPMEPVMMEKRYVRKDGVIFWADVRGVFVRDEQGEALYAIGIIQDITDRKRAEEERTRLKDQLLQAHKMESVGRLAGGVAHDFNNMLGVILGHAEMALEGLNPAEPLYADIQEIRRAANRSADLTRQLLAFARKQTVSPKVLDLNEIVAGVLQMLHRLLGEDIELIWLPGSSLWPVKMDPSQVDQILANLSVNARDAIRGVGKITIETRNVALDEAYCSEHAGCVPGDYVLLAVSDDGCGMDPKTLRRLFEPFFTTKEIGKGTGLGLATVYGIVKQNGGSISVYSERDKGTTFEIYLPRHHSRAEQMQMEGAVEVVSSGHETILLVEDEPPILNMVKKMLERFGYTVLDASTPGEALRLAEGHPGEIELLITDVIMPEMNGRDLAKRILSLYPNLKRLFMSGYTADVIAHHGVLDEEVNFIQKPFSMKDLAHKIREVLDGAREEHHTE